MKRFMLFLLFVVALFGLLHPPAVGTAAPDKPRAEDILAKHLDSIGTPEARKASPKARALAYWHQKAK